MKWVIIILMIFAVQADGGLMLQLSTNDHTVINPTDFWTNNQAAGAGFIPGYLSSNLLGAASNIAEDIVNFSLANYYNMLTADERYVNEGESIDYNYVICARDFQNFSGYNLEDVLNSIDTQWPNPVSTNIYNVTYTNLPATNASDIRVQFSPVNYSPALSNVEEHLKAIDSRLFYITSVMTNIPSTTVTLSSVTISGDNLAREGESEYYTLKAFFSNGGTQDVTTSASWQLTGAPAGTSISSNQLIVGTLTGDTNVNLQGSYSYEGVVRYDTKTITLDDTNEPVYVGLSIFGSTSINERQPAVYQAWANLDNGTSNNVSALANWGFDGAYPAGTVWNANTLTAGSVTTNTSIKISALYAIGGTIKGATNNVTIVDTNTDIIATLVYNGTYNYGTLNILGYDINTMDANPIITKQISNWSMQGTNNVVLDRPNFNGQIYLFAWVDVNTNNLLNGEVRVDFYSPSTLQTIEPGAIPVGQTATSGITIAANQSCYMTFNLSDSISWAGRQSVLQDSGCQVNVYQGATLLKTWYVDYRNYICDQDFLLQNLTLSAATQYTLVLWSTYYSGGTRYVSTYHSYRGYWTTGN